MLTRTRYVITRTPESVLQIHQSCLLPAAATMTLPPAPAAEAIGGAGDGGGAADTMRKSIAVELVGFTSVTATHRRLLPSAPHPRLVDALRGSP